MAHEFLEPTGGGFSGFLGGLTDLASAIAPIASPFIQRALAPSINVANIPQAFPGGAPIGGGGFQQASLLGTLGQFGRRILPDVGIGLGLGGLAALGTGLFAGEGGGGMATCISPTLRQSMRLPARVDVPKQDAAGNLTFVTYKNMGRPLLFQGDLAATKRVRKVAARARRAGGR